MLHNYYGDNIVDVVYIRCLKAVSRDEWYAADANGVSVNQQRRSFIEVGDRGVIRDICTEGEPDLYWFYREGKFVLPLGVGTSSLEKILQNLEAQGYIAFEKRYLHG